MHRRSVIQVLSSSSLVFVFAACHKTTEIMPPTIDQGDQAIKAVKDFKPVKHSTTVGQWETIAVNIARTTHSAYRDRGWSVQPFGDNWDVIFNYTSAYGIEHRATWRVNLNSGTVSAQDRGAMELESHIDERGEEPTNL